MGIEGAAIASIIAYAVHSLVVLTVFLRKTKLPLSEILFIRREDISSSLRGARKLLMAAPESVGVE
jgi:Na+-driven multidrug efflux pump